MIQIFTLTLAANESREVAVRGEYFELRNALFPIALVELLDRSGGVIARLENPEQSDYVKPGTYETVRITNGATAQTIRHFYGSGDAGSRRTSGLVRIDGASDVSVIDGGKNRTLAGVAFLAYSNAGGTAGNVPHQQLWNPTGSGKNLIVGRVMLSSGTAQAVRLASHNAALPTLGAVPTSKRLTGAAGIAQARVLTTSAVALGTLMYNTALLANTPLIVSFTEPIVVPPGCGLLSVGSAAGADCPTNFEYFEETV